MSAVTVLYDGSCPVCALEMRHLLARDRAGRLRYVDITAPGFDPLAYGTTLDAMMGRLHAVGADGTLLVGVDAVRAAYRAVGLGWVWAPAELALVRPALDWLYAKFARHRYRISRWLRLGCAGGACGGRN
jgi:predicted DCC family thiol-disulfide oxidoreductase YuxK